MKLGEQLETLAKLGLALNDGITIDDVLYSFDRGSYEARPFDLILFVLGVQVEREPWGRAFCDRVWNFDTECIVETGNYVHILLQLCRVAGMPGILTKVRDHVDLDTRTAWVEYTIDGKERRWDIEVNDDWADTMVLTYVMHDIERDGRRFYFKDNGQAMVLFYLDDASAERLNALSRGALKPMIPT